MNAAAAARLAEAEARLAAGLPADAEALLRRDAASRSATSRTLDLLGRALSLQGRAEQALHQFRRAVEIDPADAVAWHSLGVQCTAMARWADGHAALQRCVALAPAWAAPHANLGLCQLNLGRPAEAESTLRRGLALDPALLTAAANLGSLLTQTCRAREGVALLRQYAEASPHDPLLAEALAFCSLYDDTLAPQAVRDFQIAHGRLLAPAAPPTRPRRRSSAPPAAAAPLKVGYVSPDLHDHSVARFLEPILQHHDRREFQITLYQTEIRRDAVTARLRAVGHRWVEAAALPPAALAQRFVDDGLDLVVDLAGNTAGQRLAAFARRAPGGPAQATAIGYPATTGAPGVDFRFVDSITDPPGAPGADALCTERLVRLDPCFLCYQPEPEALATPPRERLAPDSPVVFGSFNAAAKLSPACLAAWAAILVQAPAARLLLKARHLDDPAVRSVVLSAFQAGGVDPSRVEFAGFAPGKPAHFALYNRVDIALDTFPYAGTTTTCEALIMGVPVVTLARPPEAGAGHAERVGASLLAAAGLADWVTRALPDYIAAAVDLAHDPAARAARRANLRQRVLASPLCDAPAYTTRWESALRRCAEGGGHG